MATSARAAGRSMARSTLRQRARQSTGTVTRRAGLLWWAQPVRQGLVSCNANPTAARLRHKSPYCSRQAVRQAGLCQQRPCVKQAARGTARVAGRARLRSGMVLPTSAVFVASAGLSSGPVAESQSGNNGDAGATCPALRLHEQTARSGGARRTPVSAVAPELDNGAAASRRGGGTGAARWKLDCGRIVTPLPEACALLSTAAKAVAKRSNHIAERRAGACRRSSTGRRPNTDSGGERQSPALPVASNDPTQRMRSQMVALRAAPRRWTPCRMVSYRTRTRRCLDAKA